MQHTTNYNLNQWEAGDRVTRADFNADNAKIDAALAAAASGGCRVVAGTIVGDSQPTQAINCGGQPKAVYVCQPDGSTFDDNNAAYYNRRLAFGGLALPGCPARPTPEDTEHPVIEITSTGFLAHYDYNQRIFANINGIYLYYFALL